MKRLALILSAFLLFEGLACWAQPKAVTEEYPNLIGHLRLGVRQMDFGRIITTGNKTDTLRLFNEWNQVMKIGIQKLPDYMSAKAIPEQLKPNQKGMILVTFDAAKRNDIGFLYDRLTLETNDSAQVEKIVSVSAYIVEDFSAMTPEQTARAPKIKFDTIAYDFGTIKEGDSVITAFRFTNQGEDELIIRKVKGS